MLARTLNQKPHIGANSSSPPKSAYQHSVERWFLREKPLLSTTTVSDKTVPGQYYDQETNLHYNHFRYYDPQLGRYITSDPIGISGGFNTYGYVYQNPIIYTDPTGLVCGTGACVLGAGFTVGAVVGVAQGISTLATGGDFSDGAVAGFGYGVGATTVAIAAGGTAMATGVGVAVGLGLDLLFTGGTVADLVVPDAEAAPIDLPDWSSPDPVNDSINAAFCKINPNAPNCQPEPDTCL